MPVNGPDVVVEVPLGGTPGGGFGGVLLAVTVLTAAKLQVVLQHAVTAGHQS